MTRRAVLKSCILQTPPQSLRANTGTVPQIRLHNISNLLFTHHPEAIYSDALTAPLRTSIQQTDISYTIYMEDKSDNEQIMCYKDS
jgi:hypothetical protein